MKTDFEVIWRKGDTEMPENVKNVVNAAKDELLLKSLSLPYEAADVIRYNASKSAKTVGEYISAILLVNLNEAHKV
ncbi:MAG: hypothetical protein FWB88_01990 [Defluviitaleaceae bacterium]|nr:hypothetical protein [Defluviitaleaceae bacterium]MCL2238862.1 hypothetical protein [Defluviitaleaceae bacterium]